MAYAAVDLIGVKRDGGELSADAINWLIAAYTNGDVPDYQMAAMAMAIVLNGLTTDELTAWTQAMLHSGEVLDFSDIPGAKVDKHSTGGVGDKVSIPLAPLVAACGVNVPMMSGRGLGHTGGTLDKLESIDGFDTQLDAHQFRQILSEHGVVMAGQSDTIVPADKALYSLRDATATVPSIPLISSSIMSKKLAEGLDALVLDVKTGTGAFMSEFEDALELASTMVGIGAGSGVRTVALITAMDQPLGREVGNANEIAESIAVLKGEGPEDLTRITLAFAEEMLNLGGVPDAGDKVGEAIESGSALAKLEALTEAHGADVEMVRNPELLPSARFTESITADTAGVVTRCDALTIGQVATRLGAGREKMSDVVDPAVGVTIHAKLGEAVTPGQKLASVKFNDPALWDTHGPDLHTAWTVGDRESELQPLIIDRISSDDF